MGASLDRGYSGEQDMGFYFGARGYIIVDGPSGAGGHKGNASGFDGVAYNPATGNLVIYDNKSFKTEGSVYSASAITTNFAKNIDTVIARVNTINGLDCKQNVLDALSTARTAAATGAKWPSNVQVAVSNAGGQSTNVSGKLSASGISFIDFNAAPSPVKPPSQSGGGTTATTGTAWSGPGGTPGYDASRIQNAGAALQLFQNWASQLSAMNTYYAALNQIQDRESEILALQNADPFGTVVIKVIFEIHNENLPAEMPRMYELISVEIGNESIAHGDVLGQNQHGYTIRIAALKRRANADQVRPDPKPGVNQSWQQRYETFVGTLYTRSGNVQDPAASLAKLDKLSLVDVLPILRKLKKEERFAFDRLQQALDWPGDASAFNRSTLVAAFMAVRAEENATGAFQNYVSSCNEYSMLTGDQKATIKAFISGTLAVNTGILRPQGLKGQWSAETGDVKFLVNFDVPGDDVQGQPTKSGYIFWQDTASAPRHYGEWSIAGTTLTFSFWDDPANWKRTWTAALDITNGAFKSSVIQGSAAVGGKTMGGFKFTKVGAAPAQ